MGPGYGRRDCIERGWIPVLSPGVPREGVLMRQSGDSMPNDLGSLVLELAGDTLSKARSRNRIWFSHVRIGKVADYAVGLRVVSSMFNCGTQIISLDPTSGIKFASGLFNCRTRIVNIDLLTCRHG
jgi:hypothetical protein